MMWWAIGMLGGAFLLGGGELRSFERKASQDILAKLQGEHASVKIRTDLGDPFRAMGGNVRRVTISARDFSTDGLPLYTEPGRSKRGRVRELRLDLREFSLGGLLVERLEARIPECRFDLGLAMSKRQIRLSKSGEGLGTVRVRAADLEPFILRKVREIKRVSVVISDGLVRVKGYGEFLVVQTNFEVEAKIEAVEGTKLYLKEARITFDGKPADPFSAKTLLESLNPVVDLAKDLKLLDAVWVTRVDLRDGRLIAEGRTKIPNQPISAAGEAPPKTSGAVAVHNAPSVLRSPFPRFSP